MKQINLHLYNIITSIKSKKEELTRKSYPSQMVEFFKTSFSELNK